MMKVSTHSKPGLSANTCTMQKEKNHFHTKDILKFRHMVISLLIYFHHFAWLQLIFTPLCAPTIIRVGFNSHQCDPGRRYYSRPGICRWKYQLSEGKELRTTKNSNISVILMLVELCENATHKNVYGHRILGRHLLRDSQRLYIRTTEEAF